MLDFTIKPAGDYLFVKREPAEKFDRGIAIPDNSQQAKRTGRVVAAGPGTLCPFSPTGADRFPMNCKVGDRVLLPHTGERIHLDPDDDKDELVVCRDNEILAVLEPL